MAVMYCDRRGVIGFWHALARGCVPIAYGETRKLKVAAMAMARHGYDGKTLIVTGVPEAGSDNDQAVAAVRLFSAQMSELFGLDVPLIDGKRPTLPQAYRARVEWQESAAGTAAREKIDALDALIEEVESVDINAEDVLNDA